MNLREKNLKILTKNYVYSKDMEHDNCGVGLVASTDGKKLVKLIIGHYTITLLSMFLIQYI